MPRVSPYEAVVLGGLKNGVLTTVAGTRCRTASTVTSISTAVPAAKCGRSRVASAISFFTVGDQPKLVYCASDTLAMAAEHLSRVATVVDGGRPVRMRRVSEDLHARGVRRLMVEGGGEVHTQFLSEGLADELRLVVAPLFVGQREATRFVGPGRFPFSGSRRARLVESRPIGDVVLLRYALSPRFSEGAW